MADDELVGQVRIEGVNEAADELEKLGDRGEKAFRRLQDAADKVKIQEFVKSLPEGVQGFIKGVAEIPPALKDVADHVSEIGKKFAEVTKSALKFGGEGAIAIGTISAAIGFMINSAANAEDRLDRLVNITGASKTVVQGFAAAAEQGGLGVEILDRSMFRLAQTMERQRQQSRQLAFQQEDLFLAHAKTTGEIQRQLAKTGDLAKANEDTAQASRDWLDAQIKLTREHQRNLGPLEKLGIKIKDNNGNLKTATDVYLELADVVQRLPPGFQRASAVFEVLGDRSNKTVNELSKGSVQLRKEMEAAALTTPPISEEASANVFAFQKALETLFSVITNLKDQLSGIIGPPLTAAVKEFTDLIIANRQQILGWTEDLVNKAQPIVDDFIKLLRGDQPTEGGFIDSIAKNVRGFIVAVDVGFNSIVIPAFKGLLFAANALATALNDLFGTKLTGGAILIALLVLKIVGGFGLIVPILTTIVSLATGLATVLNLPLIAIIAIGAALGFLIGRFLFGSEAVKKAWDGVKKFFGQLGSNISAQTDGVSDRWTEQTKEIEKSIADLKKNGPSDFKGFTDNIKKETQGVGEPFKKEMTDVTGSIEKTADTGTSFWSRFVDTLKSKSASTEFGNETKLIEDGFKTLGTSIQLTWDNTVAAVKTKTQTLREGLDAEWALVKQSFATIGGVADITQWDAFFEGLKAKVSQLRDNLSAGWELIKQDLVGVGSAIGTSLDSGIDLLIAKLNDLNTKIQETLSLLRQLAQQSINPNPEGGGTGLAGGGQVRGPGSTTSDSIGPVWLSNKEWIIQARAVRHYGAAFMHAINSMSFPKRGFNLGGALSDVRGLAPIRMATGGPVGGVSGRPINLSLFGEEFAGMSAPDDVAEKLLRFANTRQYSRAGRKPGWIR